MTFSFTVTHLGTPPPKHLSLVKHPRSSLLLTVLYESSYLQLQLQFWDFSGGAVKIRCPQAPSYAADCNVLNLVDHPSFHWTTILLVFTTN